MTSFSQVFRLIYAVAVVLALAPGGANAQRPPIETGFLFSEGEYIPPPYVISQVDDEIQVNGRLVLRIPPLQGPWRRFAPPKGVDHWLTTDLANRLGNDTIVMVRDHKHTVRIDQYTLQSAMIAAWADWGSGSKRDIAEATLIGAVANDVDAEPWQEWFRSYEPPQNLVSRAQEIVAETEALERANRAHLDWQRRLESMLYGLTVVAMAVSVFALGHLLSMRPPVGARWNDLDTARDGTRPTVKSLGLIVLMSAFDLGWTLRAAGDDSFRELNPIGSDMLSTPAGVSAFKVIAILLSCLLLLALRRYRGAQTATWWMCLVCTLVTFRWLMFESMFLS